MSAVPIHFGHAGHALALDGGFQASTTAGVNAGTC